MSNTVHEYEVEVRWTGNLGRGTENYRAYSRDHEISAADKKTVIAGTAPVPFGGDSARYNPEDVFVSALSSCHMLWYLMLCAEAEIVVEEYLDRPHGIMVQTPDGGGHFTEVTLHPQVVIKAGGDVRAAEQLHERAHTLCFIANSVNFTVRCDPSVRVAGG